MLPPSAPQLSRSRRKAVILVSLAHAFYIVLLVATFVFGYRSSIIVLCYDVCSSLVPDASFACDVFTVLLLRSSRSNSQVPLLSSDLVPLSGVGLLVGGIAINIPFRLVNCPSCRCAGCERRASGLVSCSQSFRINRRYHVGKGFIVIRSVVDEEQAGGASEESISLKCETLGEIIMRRCVLMKHS